MLIDRYLIRAQLQAFCIVFISLAGLTFVIDAFTNLEEFMLHAEKKRWTFTSPWHVLRLSTHLIF